MDAALSDALVVAHRLFLRFSLFISLLAGNSVAETRSTWTASATTQSYANRDFPVHCEMPRNWRGFVRAFCLCELSIGDEGPFGAFVSGRQYRVSRRRRPVLAETRVECWVSAREDGAIRAAATIRVASR